MASYFDEIAKNRIKTMFLFVVFGALFMGLLYFLIWYFGGSTLVLVIGLFAIVLYAIFSFFMGGKLILAISRAKEADPKQYAQLYSIVGDLAAANEIPMPKVYVINDPNPNAFATGRGKKAAAVAVTTGLIGMMDNTELQGVIAHEISHIFENDIQYMMIAVAFAGAVGIISIFVRNLFFFGGRNNRNGGLLMLVGLVIGLLAPLIALLIRLAISRSREYTADANGARIIRNPQALASALTKIMQYEKNPASTPVLHANEITANLYFTNPFKARSVLNMFSTHPPIEERIKRLKAMY
ncbi:MAG: M48 family metalloprotease [Candidatus Micrarchaeales archaeon]|nr:M48 family metalloprotease [Candidatus Micrarchaeales archaeon]